MTAVVGGRLSLGALDHLEAMVTSSGTAAVARRAAVLVVAESFKFDMVSRGTFTDGGSSLRKLLSNLAQILGTVSMINCLALSNFGPVVTKKYMPSSSDFVVGSRLVNNLY